MGCLFRLCLILAVLGGVAYGILYLAEEDPVEFTGRQLDRLRQKLAIANPTGERQQSTRLVSRPTPQPTFLRQPAATTPPVPQALSPPSATQMLPTPADSTQSPETSVLEVFNTQGVGLRIRSSPTLASNNITGKVFDGTWLRPQEGFQEAEGYDWQQVLLEGWVAAPWLSPAPSVTATVQVQGTGGVGLRIRTTPRITPGNILGKVFDSTQLMVLQGSRSADGYLWWNVRLEGWAAMEFIRQPNTVPNSTIARISLAQDRRFIVIPGMCTSTNEVMSGWMPGLKQWLSNEFGAQDLPLGHPGDQIIEFSYSPDGWDVEYDRNNTFRFIPDMAQNLQAIYDAYPTARFDIIAHSLGGAVALYFVAISEDSYARRTNSIITVDSPINGTDASELSRRIAAVWPGCPDRTDIEILSSQLEPGRLVPNIISRVNSPDWSGPNIATVTNINDLVVPQSSATLQGPSIECWAIGASVWLDPIRYATELKSGHDIILSELLLWFQNVIKVAYIGRLKSSAC